MGIEDYVSREVTLDVPAAEGRRRLSLLVSLGLFSSHQVDTGSRLLLRTLEGQVPDGARVLDLGCGYGTLGLALAASTGVEAVHLVDRDALALDFARENARRNGLAEHVTVAASLGLDDVRDQYDLVVSNVPGKAGDEVIASLLAGSCAVLRAGGFVAIVVIEPIREFVAATLEGMDVDVLLRRDTADYTVFHYRPRADAGTQGASGAFEDSVRREAHPPPQPSLSRGEGVRHQAGTLHSMFEAGVYDRGALAVEDAGGREVVLTTMHGLPSWDRVDVTEAALTRRVPLEVLRDAEGTVVVSNPGQGYLAVWARSAWPRARLMLVDRDLLALRASRRNVVAAGAAGQHVEVLHRGVWELRDLAAVLD